MLKKVSNIGSKSVNAISLEYGAEILDAISQNDVKKFKEILEKRLKTDERITEFCESNVKHKTSHHSVCPIILAAKLRSPRIISYMIERGSNPNFVYSRGNTNKGRQEIMTPLHIAVDLSHYDVINLLLDFNASCNVYDHNHETPLLIAAQKADWVAAQMLLAKGADPNVTDRYQNTPLHIASKFGHLQLCKVLLDAHADINLKGREGAVPVQIAAREGHVNLIELFCSVESTSINTKLSCFDDRREKSALHLASSQGHEEAVLALVDKFGADVNLKDNQWNTPLHYVVLLPHKSRSMKDRKHFTNTARLLLERRANPNVRNAYGDTPLHLAAMNQFPKIVELMLQYGARPDAENAEHLKPMDIVPSWDHLTRQILKTAFKNCKAENRRTEMMDVPNVYYVPIVTKANESKNSSTANAAVSIALAENNKALNSEKSISDAANAAPKSDNPLSQTIPIATSSTNARQVAHSQHSLTNGLPINPHAPLNSPTSYSGFNGNGQIDDNSRIRELDRIYELASAYNRGLQAGDRGHRSRARSVENVAQRKHRKSRSVASRDTEVIYASDKFARQQEFRLERKEIAGRRSQEHLNGSYDVSISTLSSLSSSTAITEVSYASTRGLNRRFEEEERPKDGISSAAEQVQRIKQKTRNISLPSQTRTEMKETIGTSIQSTDIRLKSCNKNVGFGQFSRNSTSSKNTSCKQTAPNDDHLMISTPILQLDKEILPGVNINRVDSFQISGVHASVNADNHEIISKSKIRNANHSRPNFDVDNNKVNYSSSLEDHLQKDNRMERVEKLQSPMPSQKETASYINDSATQINQTITPRSNQKIPPPIAAKPLIASKNNTINYYGTSNYKPSQKYSLSCNSSSSIASDECLQEIQYVRSTVDKTNNENVIRAPQDVTNEGGKGIEQERDNLHISIQLDPSRYRKEDIIRQLQQKIDECIQSELKSQSNSYQSTEVPRRRTTSKNTTSKKPKTSKAKGRKINSAAQTVYAVQRCPEVYPETADEIDESYSEDNYDSFYSKDYGTPDSKNYISTDFN